MTNVRRPVHLPLQRPSLTMVSSSSGPSPFGVVAGESGSGASGNVSGVSPVAHILGSGPLSGGGAQQSPGQPAAPRAAPIRPNALINFNCITQAPSIPSNLASPMQQPMMMGSFSSAAASSSTLVSPRSSRSMNIGGPQRPTCCPTTRSGAAPGDHAIPALNYPCHNRHNYHQHYHHHTKALSPSGLNDSLPSQIMPHLFVGNQEQTNRETVNKLNIKYILSLGLLPMIIANGGSTSVTTLTSPISPTVAAINKKASSKSKNHHNHHHHHHHHHLQQPQHLMPGPNSSRDFKIRIRSNTPTTPTTPSNNSTTSNLNTIVNTSTTTNTATQQAAIVSAAGIAETISPTATTATTTSTTNTTLIPPPPTKPRDENKGIKQVRSVYCKCINIADNSDQLLDKFFEEAYMFIDEARRKKCNILIHCLAGISRSPTIAIAYLMRVRSLHWKDAYDLVKQCRPQIDPNLNFMGQLRIYNKSLRDEHRPAAAIGGGTTGGSGKRNNNISSSGINDSPLISDDCHNATTIKQNCCIDNHNNGNGGNTTLVVVGHESTNVTANLRDKDNN